MVWAFIAATGAAIAIAIREHLEWRERVAIKRANCYHIYNETIWHQGYGTRICERCGYQDFVEREKPPR